MILQDYLRIQLGIQLLLILSLFAAIAEASSLSLVKPGCQDKCGNVSIPYPFGVGSNCSYNSSFEISCNKSRSHHPKPFLTKLNVEVLEINHIQQSLRVNIWPQRFLCSRDKQEYDRIPWFNATGSPFRYSTSENMFVMRGCPGSVLFSWGNPGSVSLMNENGALVGCAAVCKPADVVAESTTTTSDCNGIGCCKTPIPNLQQPLQSYNLSFNMVQKAPKNHTSLPCYKITIIESASVKRFTENVSGLRAYPSVLQYSVEDLQFSSNTNCSAIGEGCQCNDGYEGNPYLPNGCQVPKACEGCKGRCVRKESDSHSCELSKTSLVDLEYILGLTVAVGLIPFFVFCFWLHAMLRRRREIKQRAKYFHLLLRQHVASNGDVLERTKLFSTKELKRATDNFNEDRILGHGGQGIVYKGMLANGQIVAIKKPRLVDESHMGQFINEVVILSQINHRNVVRLYGCCLDAKSPFLVYEFISKGTLSAHLHRYDSQLTWKMRLQIATESSAAIAYLHSSSSSPIYHRDIKSSNILLDEKFRAKVSDFGISRTINIDQTHFTTICVRGTLGYLDPEYFETHQFTEKSDVYSFGVVLVEILTGKKPISIINSVERRSLTTEFLFMMENFCLSDILDPRVSQEARKEEVLTMANLAKQCLNSSGNRRPTMREVANILEGLRASHFPASSSSSFEKLHDETCYTTTTDHLMQSTTFFTASIDGTSPPVVDAQPLLRDTV